MENELYFMPILLDALDAGASADALSRAFDRICELGRREEFAEGYGQFLLFMAEGRVCADREGYRAALISLFAVALAVDALDEDEAARNAVLRLMASRPDGNSRWEDLRRELFTPGDWAAPMEIILYRDGEEWQRFHAQPIHEAHEIRGISPGMYGLSLSTGWRVWESALTVKDVEWARAFPRHPLQMAADTGTVKRVPSRTWRILEETIELRLFPGIETGVLEILVHV